MWWVGREAERPHHPHRCGWGWGCLRPPADPHCWLGLFRHIHCSRRVPGHVHVPVDRPWQHCCSWQTDGSNRKVLLQSTSAGVPVSVPSCVECLLVQVLGCFFGDWLKKIWNYRRLSQLVCDVWKYRLVNTGT